MRVTLIAALAENGVIGRDGGLPWSLPDDLQHFKQLTLGRPIVMGHATARSLGRPLPKRTNLVLSRGAMTLPGFTRVQSLEEAFAHAHAIPSEELCVIGGAQIYALFLPHATHLELTHVASKVEGDTFFPEVDMHAWVCVREVDHPTDARHAFAFRVASYVRR